MAVDAVAMGAAVAMMAVLEAAVVMATAVGGAADTEVRKGAMTGVALVVGMVTVVVVVAMALVVVAMEGVEAKALATVEDRAPARMEAVVAVGEWGVTAVGLVAAVWGRLDNDGHTKAAQIWPPVYQAHLRRMLSPPAAPARSPFAAPRNRQNKS